MYIVSRHQDYEQPDLIFAHGDEIVAVREAQQAVVAHLDAKSPVESWPAMPNDGLAALRAAQQGIDAAPDLGPALTAVMSWRVRDLFDYTVYKVVTAR